MKCCTVEHLTLQGSAATEFRCGGRFYFTVFRSLSTNPKVKELSKSVHICQSYRNNNSGTFFMVHGVVIQQMRCSVKCTISELAEKDVRSCGMRLLSFLSSLAVAVTIVSNHFAYPRRDNQAELAWVAWLNIKTVYRYPRTAGRPSQY